MWDFVWRWRRRAQARAARVRDVQTTQAARRLLSVWRRLQRLQAQGLENDEDVAEVQEQMTLIRAYLFLLRKMRDGERPDVLPELLKDIDLYCDLAHDMLERAEGAGSGNNVLTLHN
ncbi:hypothetical protein [Thiomonas sp.]|uniref:hypothetical protein n=1 Tax=Thiomonas sp. TaxID=2047785 RepID=UPI0026280ED4|nr:hypothetical protein [Thiomonas sp.]